MKLTAQDSLSNGIIDEIVSEPVGGAHRNYAAAAEILGEFIKRHLDELSELGPAELVEDRWARFRKIGVYKES